MRIGVVGIRDVAAASLRGRAPTDDAAGNPAGRRRPRAAAGTAQDAAAAQDIAERATWDDLAVGGLFAVLVEGV